MYIKNRRNSNRINGFGSYQTLCLTENLVLCNRLTFHILTVSNNLEPNFQPYSTIFLSTKPV